MGKEIKISLAVITVLLGGMSYALYRQFAPGDDNQSTQNQANESAEAPGSASSTEAKQSQAAAESTHTTVVAATSGSPDGTGAASKSTDPWAAASGSAAAQGQEAARAGSSDFTFMPQAVPAAPAGRYASGYGSDASGAATSDSWSTNQGTASTQPRYDTYRTYGSQSTTSTYPSGSTPSTGTGGSTVQSPADQQTGYQGYQYSNPASRAGSTLGTSGTNVGANWSSSAGYAGMSDSHGSSVGQNALPNQYGAGTSGASAQSSPSYGANTGSQYGTSGSYGQPGAGATIPAAPSAAAYPANSTSTYSTYSTYADDSPSTYGSSTTAPTTGQSSAGQNSFGQSNFGQSGSAENDVIQTQPREGKYLIQPNDSYWTISQRLYGTGAYFRALAEHNRSKNSDTHQLRVAEEIDTPSVSTLEATYPSLCPKPSHREAIEHRASVARTTAEPSGSNVYTVQAGDTLFDIARYELGKASRWVEIYQLNRQRLGKNFDYLTPGLKLALPVDRPTETVTQQPGAGYRR